MQPVLPIRAFESERHPDITVYATRPPAEPDEWANWVRALVVEVVLDGLTLDVGPAFEAARKVRT
jgi:hypothetical protein